MAASKSRNTKNAEEEKKNQGCSRIGVFSRKQGDFRQKSLSLCFWQLYYFYLQATWDWVDS